MHWFCPNCWHEVEEAREDAGEAAHRAINRAPSQLAAHAPGDVSDERSPQGKPR